MQSRQSIVYVGDDMEAAAVVCGGLNQIYPAYQFISTKRLPTDTQLCECQFVIADLDSGSLDKFELFLQCLHQCPFLKVLAIVRRGDVETAVQAIRQGAAHCVEKPVDATELKATVARILHSAGAISIPTGESLTRTERIVLAGVLQGRTTKAIAVGMHRSPRTIEVHRKHIMRKLRASTLTDLVLLATNNRDCQPNRAADRGPTLQI
jgi:two-component system, LuxR family, response regulator FixJ